MPSQPLKLPGDFINRKAERDLFDGLLQLNDEARLLAIEDKKGTGKSTLLELLEHNCKYIVEVAVSRVPLEESTINSSITFIERVRKGFGMGLTFKKFDELNQARLGKNGSAFSPSTPVLGGGVVDARATTLSGPGSQIVGSQVNSYGTLVLGGPPEWNSELADLAKGLCIQAFFYDLKLIADEKPVVVLLDSFERCNVDLRPWISDDFLLPLCFRVNSRPARLVLGMAGRELPDFAAVLGPEKHEKLVRSRSLSGWEKEHVKDFLRVHGYGNLSDKDVEIVWAKVEQGFSIGSALNLAAALA